jgi:hypothetical protein
MSLFLFILFCVFQLSLRNILFFFFLFGENLWVSALQSRPSIAWAKPPVHFALVNLEMGVSRTVCLDLPQSAVLLISASQVAWITGVSHQCLARTYYSYWLKNTVYETSYCQMTYVNVPVKKVHIYHTIPLFFPQILLLLAWKLHIMF